MRFFSKDGRAAQLRVWTRCALVWLLVERQHSTIDVITHLVLDAAFHHWMTWWRLTIVVAVFFAGLFGLAYWSRE